MAIKDFRKYLHTCQSQYLTAKEDLAEFEQCLAQGLITEDRLADIKQEFEKLEANYQRLVYADYLLCLPQQKAKSAKFKKMTASRANTVLKNNTDIDVYAENQTALDIIKAEIAKIQLETGK